MAPPHVKIVEVTDESLPFQPSDRHHMPDDSQEFAEWEDWLERVKQRQLPVVDSIACWTDICGFGRALESAQWDLNILRDQGVFDALSLANTLLGRPFYIGVPPAPSERVLLLNDGIARTIDLARSVSVDQDQMLSYVRDLLMHHCMLERCMIRLGLGLRTVLAGGQRCQYAPPRFTGQSLLFYTNEPSPWGKRILEQQFVYYPSEFQMNTAFALAFTLEAKGSRGGLVPNRLYIEEGWLATLNKALPGIAVCRSDRIEFPWKGAVGLTIEFDDQRSLDVKGKRTRVFRVCEFTVHEGFESEQTIFAMAEHDRNANS